MALLALVAAAGKRGISRERILGILWSETGEEQARHTLSQNLYSLRRETGRDWIATTPELRLDPAITSDVGEFQDALAAQDFARAAALYTGEFLEGFYLPGVPKFERWVEEERAGLKSAALRALESLATRADQVGRFHEATGWWRRLADLDPLSARYASGLMRALAAAGDHASALAHARDHRETVKRELDAGLDPAVQALVASLKGPASPSQLRNPAPPAPSVPVPFPGTVPAPDQALAPVGHRRRRRILAPILTGVVLVAVVIAREVLSGDRPPGHILAVGVIRTDDSTRQGGVLRDMLATSLAGVPGLQVLANSRLIELMLRGADTIPGATTDAARRAGVTEIIEGEMVPGSTGLTLTLRRVALASGVVRRGYSVQGTDPSKLVDSATAAIARDLNLAAPAAGVATIRTSSPAAYALYEEGLRAYYKWDHAAAYRLMKAALELDSSFAMAAYYAWSASKDLGGRVEGDRDLLQGAKVLAPRALDRERLIIEASVAGQEAPTATAAAIAETLSVRYPEDPDGQILLGSARWAAGDFAASVAAFQRAVAMDSAMGAAQGAFCRMCEALRLLVDGYVWWDSLSTAERTARRFIALRPDEALAWSTLVEPLLRQGRRPEAVAARQKADSLATPGASQHRGMFQRDLIRWGDFEELDRQLLDDLLNPSLQVRSEGRWLMLFSLRNQGRLREAMALARDHVIPGSPVRVTGVPAEGMMQAALAMESGRPFEAARQFRDIAASTLGQGHTPGFKARFATWVLTLAGTALAAAGDTAGVRRMADSTERLGKASNFGRDPRLHHVLRGLVLQREGRHAEAVEAFRQAVFSTTDGYTRINLEMARSLMALGRPNEAIAILQPALRGGVDGSNSYVTHTELHEALAHAFERAGQADSAAAHYRAVERAWRRADPQFAARYAEAKAKAASLH